MGFVGGLPLAGFHHLEVKVVASVASESSTPAKGAEYADFGDGSSSQAAEEPHISAEHGASSSAAMALQSITRALVPCR
jgi:hypothetical protein